MSRPRRRVTVFAVEDTTAQVCWSALPPGTVRIAAGDAAAEVEVPDRPAPGSVVLEGLAPGTQHRLEVTAGGRPVRLAPGADRFRTLAPPPGEVVARFATISDMHIGERGFGIWPRVREPAGVAAEDSFTVRSTRAAIAEAVAWGAELVVAKGDLTYSGRPAQWDLAAKVLTGAPVPVHATLGNHDVPTFAADGRRALAAHGIVIARGPECIDVPGLRIVVGHTAHRGRRGGTVDERQRADLVRLAAEAPGPVLVALHHFPDPLPFPSRYPRGIAKAEGDAL
ncbi:MAG TPA: metallophosphoesterase, partial [Acidimicrobiales bacterium]|nr:metallophosphoesterase [Acidimicrobiales bacterium]